MIRPRATSSHPGVLAATSLLAIPDNWDAYVRNSPIAHALKVQTPLVLRHNDKDGAVGSTRGYGRGRSVPMKRV